MAKEAIGNNPLLQVEILVSLINIHETMEALYFAEVYNIPRKKWPLNLVHYYNSISDLYGNFLTTF
jgi:hypothetical protein